MMSNFHVGQKVICIDVLRRQNGKGYGDEILPVKGKVYTIRGFGPLARAEGGLGVVLEEIVNKVRRYNIVGKQEPHFNIDRFRPVRTTNISIFTAMLAPKPRVKEPTE